MGRVAVVAEPLLVIDSLVKRYGGLVALDQVSMQITPGTLHAVIGPNGAGKTTLAAHVVGELLPDRGKVWFAGQDITRLPPHVRSALGLGRSFQITSIFSDLTVLDNVALAVQARAGHSFRFWRAADRDASLRMPALECLVEVGLDHRAEQIAGTLAHGEKRALEVAMVLATRPRLLVLDEPMAGMGHQDSARLVRLLARLKTSYTVMLVEHDMDAVFALADQVTVLVYGRIIATGSGEQVRRDEAVRHAYLGEREAS